MMRIDAHQHYWHISRGDYGWITPELPALYRDFRPSDLRPELAAHRLDGTILVQAAPTYAETDYLLSVAEADDTVLGVVGWLDLSDPAHWEHCERHRAHPKYRGFRIMIQDMPDARAILEPTFLAALRRFEERQTPVDLLVTHAQLEPLTELLAQVPNLRGVINHIAKPDIRGGEAETWFRRLGEIAAYPNLYCKLSGVVTEADHRRWKLSDVLPYVRSAANLFGPDRVMFGSDWPVCLLAASYGEVVTVFDRSLPDTWSAADRAQAYGANAARFYGIEA